MTEFREKHAGEVTFYQYLQWELHRQIGEVERTLKQSGLKLGLYQDLPLAVDTSGFDVWLNRKLFAPAMSSGAPPDPLFSLRSKLGLFSAHPGNSRA